MFEGQLAYYLNTYLGSYVYGLDPQSLKVSVFSGDVVLRNLRLKPSALADLNLPLSIKSGLLGSLTLKVPWRSLGRTPVVVEMDRLYILAGPKQEEAEDLQVDANDDDVEQLVKQRRVEAAESSWHAGMGKEEQGAAGKPGRFQAIIDTVIGNIQLVISNIHIRYEDDVSNPELPFAVGVTLERLTAHTVDEDGKQAFVTNNPMELLRKASELRRFALYFDVGTELWRTETDWADMQPSAWDALFQPSISVPGEGQEARSHTYVLQPIDGHTTYLRRGPKGRESEDQAVQQADVGVDAISIHLSRPQYLSVHSLLDELSAYSARLPNSHLRPRSRPKTGPAARRWWQYAIKVAVKKTQGQSLSWNQVHKVVEMRRRYVPLYVRCLQENKQGGDDEVHQMDRQLPEAAILVFRRLAHAKVEKEKRRLAAIAAAEQKAKQAQSWIGWLTGAKVNAAPNAEDAEMRGDLNDEEAAKLQELVDERDAAIQAASDSPHSLNMEVRLRIEAGAIVLDGEPGAPPVLRAGTRGAVTVARMYPKTISVRTAVAGMGVVTPHGMIVRSGTLLPPASSMAASRDGADSAEVRQVSDNNALEVEFVQAPQDGSADTVVNLILAPSYITYHAATVQSLATFFQTEQEVDLSALGAQAIAQVERTRKQAAAQLAAAMHQRPKLALHAQLNGPKIAIPIPASSDGQGKLALVVDLGSCTVESDTALAASLPANEAALYECIKLKIKDVSAYAVDGEFSFSAIEQSAAREHGQAAEATISEEMTAAVEQDDGVALGGAAVFIPLLQRCGTSALVQAARFPDASKPTLRTNLSVPSLRFHFSPGRVRRIMRILHAALPGSEQGSSKQQSQGQQAWRLEPDAAAKMRVLEWGGLARASATWQRRYVCLYRGHLYTMEQRTSKQELASHNIWLNRRVVRVPQKLVGVPHVLAVCPEDLEVAKAPEDSSSVLLRFASDAEAEQWLQHLQRSQQTMRLLAGTTGGEDSQESEDLPDSASAASTSDAGPQSGSQAPSTQVKLDVSVQLGEVALFVSGRCAEVWWPAEESLAETGERPLVEPQAKSVSRSGDIVNVDNEVSLVVVRAAGGSATAQVADAHVAAGVAVGSFEIEDLLVGSRCSGLGYLARSFEADADEDEEEFMDADPKLKSLERDSLDSTRSEAFQDAPGPSELPDKKKIGAWVMDFESWKPESTDYANVDSELRMRLTQLYFFCNRPTVGALMALGSDLGDSFKAGDQADSNQGQEQDQSNRTLQGAESSASESDYEPDALVRSGGDERTTFKLVMEVQRLQATLNYESSNGDALALTSIEDVRFNLGIHPSTMGISASLGNLRAQDATLAEDHPYRNICSVRQDASTSLIELQFDMLSPAEAASNSLVPSGLPFCTLQAQMRELQVVFLSRFVFEMLRYINLMLKLRPAPQDAASQDQAETSAAATASPQAQQGSGAPFVLQLNLRMDAPVIAMPRYSDSNDNVKVDLGAVHMSNRVTWHTGHSLNDPQAVLLEEDEVRLTDLRAEVLAEGHQGGNMIREYDDGMRLQLQRPLLDRHKTLPGTAVAMDLPSIKATMSDREFALIVSIAGDNFGEEQRVPSGAAWLEDMLNAEEAQDDDENEAGDVAAPGLAERTGNLAKSLYMGAGDEKKEGGAQPQQAPPRRSSGRPAAQEGEAIALRAAINLGKSELELLRTSNQATGALTPLARFTVRNLWVVFTSMQNKNLGLQLSLPWVEGEDMRPWVPREHALVISSSDQAADQTRTPASLLTMQWDARSEMSQQTLQVRLQRPTVSAEMSFMLAVTQFFVPNFAMGGTTPTAFHSYDLVLTGEHAADADIWLSPEARLLADSQNGPEDLVYDGCGHRIILPQEVALDDPLPLILVGSGKTLILRNVRIVHASSLPACLQLAPGAQLVARPEDQVDLLEGADSDLEEHVDRAHFYASSITRGSFMRPGSQKLTRPSQSGQRASTSKQRSPEPIVEAPKTENVIVMDVAAVGVCLRFLELEASAQEGQELSRSQRTEAQPEAHTQGQALRMLAAYLDTTAHVRVAGEQQEVKAQLRGLRLETQVDLGTHDGQAPESGRVQGTVLEPCTIEAKVTMRPGGAGDCAVSISDVRLNVSADLLELAQSLQQTVLAPLVAPSPDRPLAMCTHFVRQWTSQTESIGAAGAIVSTHVLGGDQGLTFWRPQPPMGYAITGDCAVAGSAQPTFQAVAIAINSGFVTYPKSYTQVYTSPGLTVWRATPPEGYVALGCLVTTSQEGSTESGAPSLTDMVCVHASIGVYAPLGQCLDLSAATKGQQAGERGSQNVNGGTNVWCIDNALATFDVCTAAQGTPKGPFLDLRSPMGISPMALSLSAPAPVAKAASQPKTKQEMLASQRSYKDFQSARDALSKSSSQRRQRAQTVDFRRIWWDRDVRNPTRTGLSVWRPVPPAGYVALGDCLGNGHDPPGSVTVLLDSADSAGNSLLKPADDLVLVWRDETAREDKCLSLWQPRAPARYAAMGLIASLGTQQPDPHLARCVRENEVDNHETRGLSPSMVLQEAGRRVRLACWLADERLGAFTLTAGKPPQGSQERPPAMLRLRLLNREEQQSVQDAASAAGGGLNFVVKAGATSVLVRDALRRPLAEVELGSLQASLSRLSSSVSQAYVGVQVAVWSFNAPIGAWEPMLEPWNLILNGDFNTSKQVSMGVAPGAHLHLKSTSEMLRLTVAYAAAASFMRALLEWRDLHAAGAGDAYKRQLAAADASSLHTIVDNVLGVPAQLQLDFGDRMSTSELAPGKVTPVLQPLPKAPLRHTQRQALPAQALPPPLLLLDLQRMHAGSLSDDSAWGRAELVAIVTLQTEENKSPDGTSAAGDAARTRAVVPIEGIADWSERLFLTLPVTSGGRQPVHVAVEIQDSAGDGGKGCVLARGLLQTTPPEWPDVTSKTVQLQSSTDQDVALEVVVARVLQWKTDTNAPSDAYLARGSTAGQRAMRIGGQGAWLWVPSTALQPAASPQTASKRSSGAVGSSVVPIRADALGGCALESNFRGGVKHELLRSLCQVHNTTQLRLQVALASVPRGDDWQVLPEQAASHKRRSSSSSGQASTQSPVEEELFENERYVLLRGWSGSHLLPTERKRFSRRGQSFNEFPRIPAPEGWQWDGEWDVERQGYVDKDGWAYFADFSTSRYPPPQGAQKRGLVDFTRRRRLVRRRKPMDVPQQPQAAGSRQQVQPAQPAPEVHRDVVGAVEPGDSLPLPPSWRSEGKEVQIRPLVQSGADSAHAWSTYPGRSETPLTLHALDDAQSCLATCAPSHSAASPGVASLMDAEPTASGMATNLAAAQAVFSITVEGDVLADSDGAPSSAEPLTDWRLVVAPALTVQNLLPLRGTFLVWEQPQDGGNLVLRQSGQVESGARAHIYAASVQQPVSLQFYPDGYDWAEAEPVPLWHGTSSDQAGSADLPDRFRITPGSGPSSSQLILMDREIDIDAWVLQNNDALRNPGTAVAAGLPLVVRLLVPLWVVNATMLPISVGIADMGPPQQSRSPPGDPDHPPPGRLDTNAIKMKVLEASVPDRVELRDMRQVMANSVAMIGYPLPQLQVLRTQQSQQHYGVRLKVGNSGWTAPMPLESGANGETDQLNTQPVLIRARIPSWGTRHEVVARLDLVGGGFARTTALRLEPHHVISNHTGIPLQLMHYRPQDMKQNYGRKAGGATEISRGSTTPSGLPRASPTGPTGQPGLKGAVHEQGVDWTSVLELPHGACGVPLAWSLQSEQRALCVRLKPESSRAPPTLWSIPVKADEPEAGQRHLLIPISVTASQPQPPQGGSAGQEPAATSPAYLRRIQTMLTAEGPAWQLHGPRVARRIKHLSMDSGRGSMGGPADMEESEAVVLRSRTTLRSPGCIHIVLESVSPRAPYMLENRSAIGCQYRQAGLAQMPPAAAAPWSAAAFAWLTSQPSQDQPDKVEVQDATGRSSAAYQLAPADPRTLAADTGFTSTPSSLAALSRLPPLSVGSVQLQAAVKDHDQEVMIGAGLRSFGGGGTLGRSHPYRVLRLTPGKGTAFVTGKGSFTALQAAEESAGMPVHFVVEVNALEVSLVDSTPEELLAASLMGLRVEYAAGIGPEGDFIRLGLKLDSAQLDDEQPTTRFPVVVRPAPLPDDGQGEVQPLVQMTAIMQVQGPRGSPSTPYLSFRITRPLVMAVAETMVWRTAEFVERLNLGALSASDDGQSVAATPDMPVAIHIINVSDLNASVSFRGDQTARPRHVANQMGALAWGLDMANFENVPVALQGFEFKDESMLWSVLIDEALRRIKGQLMGVAISFLRNFGVLKGASGALGALSAGVGSLTGDDSRQRQEARAERDIGGVGQGLVEGGTAFGTGFLRGVTGLVTKPLQGAQAGGATGFVKGVGQGIVGVAANPISGALDFMSSAFEGMDASSAALLKRTRAAEAQRARLPRAIAGDKRLLPFLRPDGHGVMSDKQARMEALGQALLRRCQEGGVSALGLIHVNRRRARVAADAYEEHLVLHGPVVALLTNRRLLCLHAPGFAALHARAEASNAPIPMSTVPAAELKWAVEWQDVLELELRDTHHDGRPPNRLVVHRKGTRPAQGETDSLTYELHCSSRTSQAEQLKAIALRVKDKFTVTPADTSVWTRRHAEQAPYDGAQDDRDLPPQQLPASMPSLDYKQMWRSDRDKDGNAISVWRPVGPPGFQPVGDIAVVGYVKPVEPVQVLRDDSVLQQPSAPEGQQPAAGRAMPAVEYHLVWREPTPNGVTIWEPIPPRGYAALGACVSSTADAPLPEQCCA